MKAKLVRRTQRRDGDCGGEQPVLTGEEQGLQGEGVGTALEGGEHWGHRGRCPRTEDMQPAG